jgi:hypothetical protein
MAPRAAPRPWRRPGPIRLCRCSRLSGRPISRIARPSAAGRLAPIFCRYSSAITTRIPCWTRTGPSTNRGQVTPLPLIFVPIPVLRADIPLMHPRLIQSVECPADLCLPRQPRRDGVRGVAIEGVAGRGRSGGSSGGRRDRRRPARLRGEHRPCGRR